MNRTTILTYHRVVGRTVTWKFHDVAWPLFVGHVRAVLKFDGNDPIEFTFDDSTHDHFHVATVLRDAGLPATFFVIVGKLDTPGYLTSAQVRQMARRGCRIGSHTVTHHPLVSLDDAAIRRELVESRTLLQLLAEQPVDWFAPPGGLYDERVVQTARDVGYRVIRTMEWGYAPANPSGLTPTIPIFNHTGPHAFRRIVEGRAPLWPFHLKETGKRLMGADRYVAWRDRFGRWTRRQHAQ